MDDLAAWRHGHTFDTDRPAKGEVRTRWVVAITLVMMVAEVVGGIAFGSMALLADGWHMGTHAAALGVALFAYVYARTHATDPRYSFGTGKVGALGGFASAVGLAVVALLVLTESVSRLARPVGIRFDEAIAVACVGLAVNLLSAWLLRGEEHAHGAHAHGTHAHEHEHEDEHEHASHERAQAEHAHAGHEPQHRDHNLRAAYLHVLADALTSVLAIFALLTGKSLGWTWMDPAMGIVGALVIARWSVGLLRDTSAVLLDAEVGEARREAIRAAVEETPADRVADLHVWRVGPRHLAAIVSIVSPAPRAPAEYAARLRRFEELAHVTIEVHARGG